MKMSRRHRNQVVLFLITVLCVVSVPSGSAQSSSGVLKGKVVDLESKKPIEGVLICLEKTDFQSTSDKLGQFTLFRVPVGRYTVWFERLGYIQLLIENIRISPDSTTRVEAQLQKLPVRLSQFITVYGDPLQPNAFSPVSTVKLDTDDMIKTPGAVRDISRVLTVNPGISRVSDLSNDLIVRGGRHGRMVFLSIISRFRMLITSKDREAVGESSESSIPLWSMIWTFIPGGFQRPLETGCPRSSISV